MSSRKVTELTCDMCKKTTNVDGRFAENPTDIAGWIKATGVLTHKMWYGGVDFCSRKCQTLYMSALEQAKIAFNATLDEMGLPRK